MSAEKNLGVILEKCPVMLNLTGNDSQSVIDELVSALVDAGLIDGAAKDDAIAAVCQREVTGSTAIANGIALPHGYIDAVSQMTVAIGIHRQGVDFGAMDGRKSRVFVLMLNPLRAPTSHISFIVALNRKLHDAVESGRILKAQTREELLKMICD